MLEDKNNGIFLGRDSDFNRSLVESKSTRSIILNHSDNKHDSLYERDSGINQVICKLAKKNNVSFIIDMNEVFVSDKKSMALIISRIIQNIRLINKYKNSLRVIFPKFVSNNQANGILLSLGSSTELASSSSLSS